MVITIEPGIYIPIGSCDKKWWGIVNKWIEDDILITPDPFSNDKKMFKEIREIEEPTKENKCF
jgi:Xaa-Pro aminopeptidase